MRARRTGSGFTLLETVIAMTLLAVMLGMLFGGLRAGVRAWDAGSGRGDRADQVLLASSFLRKELSAAFPWRFKDPLAVKLAFRGEPGAVRFVSMRPAEIGGGGLAFVSFAFEPGRGATPGRLVMRREFAASEATDFAAVDAAEPFALLEGVSAARFSYYGAENDVTQPAWTERWEFAQRTPSHVRLELSLGDTRLPDTVVALRLGEEAGCYESSFQRTCVPRR
ncbi:MAG: prepilin-type N-terminal cleavage/methylation domain-containing protein [Burkholderiales bacterium]